MKISREKLRAEAAATGYRPEILEKVIHLVNLLGRLNAHPFLKGKWALKGGTALNLFVFDLPRLSVDIDLNYVASADRAAMLADKPRVEQALNAVFGREGFTVNRQPGDHAGGKWRLKYQGAGGEGGNLEVDVNFMLRVPLWPVITMDSKPVGSYRAIGIPLLDVHELSAGKLAALLARRASRDLFDAHRLLTTLTLDVERLRVGFVLYGGMNRVDWRTVSVADLGFEERELREQLTPVLSEAAVEKLGPPGQWVTRLLDECREALRAVLPLRENEREFLDRLNGHGEVRPEFLTNDAELAGKIATHPALRWKAVNVKKHIAR